MIGDCELCGRWGELEKHHVFGGACRQKSERYNATIMLCHACHNEPPNGLHFNAERNRRLKKQFQVWLMLEQGWTVGRFVDEFGQSYL